MRSILLFSLMFLGHYLMAQNTYIEAGVPATDRIWQANEYIEAYQSIMANQLALPTLKTANGKALVERLASSENLSFCRDSSIPIMQRFTAYLQIQQGQNAFLMAYASQLYSGQPVGTETAEMIAQALRIAEVGIELVEEFIPQMPKDETYQTRIEGFMTMRNGLMTAMNGVITTLSETQFFTPTDMTIIIKSMQKTMPAYLTMITPQFKTECILKLKKLKNSFEGQNLEMLTDIITLMENAADSSFPPSK